MSGIATAHTTDGCKLSGVPDQVDAGTEVFLQVEASTEGLDDPADLRALIVDDKGQQCASCDLHPTDSEGDSTGVMGGEMVLAVPSRPGTYRYGLHIHAMGEGPRGDASQALVFTISAVAHRIAPVVWDVPAAVEPGEAFTIKVAGQCGSVCRSAGWTVVIRDQEGQDIAITKIGNQPWQGTDRLCHADLRLTAPRSPGLYSWEALISAPDADLLHVPARYRFGFHVTPHADARLIIEAFDADTGEGVAGLQVVTGPYRTRTDDTGRAAVRVPHGFRRVFVSGGRYLPHRSDLIVEDEVTLTVTMTREKRPTEAMIWG